MSCLQLHLHTLREHTESLSDFLENASALSVTWQPLDEQSLYEPPLDSTPLWQHVKISAVFDEKTSLPALLDALKKTFDEKIILAHDAWRPEKNTFWKWIKPAALAECVSASVGDCEFIL